MNSLRWRVALAAVAAAALALVLLGTTVTWSLSVQERRDPVVERLAERFPRLEGRLDAAELRLPTARSVGNRILVVGAGVLLVVAVAGLGIGAVALEPLAALRRSAADIAATGELDRRLPRAGPVEVDELAVTLNAMLARLQTAEHQRSAALAASRRFAADAGHELRTPLTAMRADLDVLAGSERLGAEDRAVLEDVRREQERLTALVDGLLLLARGDAEVPRERLDLAELADRVVVHASRRHPAATVELTAPEQVPVTGWSDGLRVALDNLVDNALRHGQHDVHVVVTLATDEDGTTVLTVDDDGPGIDPADRARVLERFERGRTAAPGSGLGLALVAQQARLHAGSVELSDSPLGGTRVRMTLGRAGTSSTPDLPPPPPPSVDPRSSTA
ncbi:MAG: ATP-binding protein [Nitriliruptoraceae bacterium]